MLRRKAYDQLLNWKNSENHKCLLVKGQRQVGKTFLIDAFAKDNYEHYVHVDFSANPEYKSAFKDNLNVDTIIRNLSVIHGVENFIPGSTLIFLDEIQECPAARTSLKQFTLDGRFDVIASGSLLGIHLPDSEDVEPLLPVGYETHITLRSLDFEEFLWANNIPEDIIAEVRDHIRSKTTIPSVFQSKFDELFKDYILVGGMPDSVNAYLKKRNCADSARALQDIIETCTKDITRYNRGAEKLKTAECFNSIPKQLAELNKKFMYSRIRDDLGTRRSMDRYAENLLWIKNAGYGNFCYAVKEPSIPLEAHTDLRSFKIYMSDTGILMHMYGRSAAIAVDNDDNSFNKGAIMENAVAECLSKSGYTPYYYRRRSGTDMIELDFITEMDGKVAAIEVKSGKDRFAPSIKKAANIPGIARRIMFENSNVSVDENGLEHYPLFAAAFIRDMDKYPPLGIWEEVSE